MIQDGKAQIDIQIGVTMRGDEAYKIVGGILTEKDMAIIGQSFKGLQLYGDCLSKNLKAFEYLNRRGDFFICMGSLEVCYQNTEYGFLFNPPFEFHAFLVSFPRRKLVVDVSLPGVILRAQQSGDAQGRWLDGLEPFIMAGGIETPARLNYAVHKFLSYREAVRMVQR
jgi:hypothetical protein